jgi:hypothetical protein
MSTYLSQAKEREGEARDADLEEALLDFVPAFDLGVRLVAGALRFLLGVAVSDASALSDLDLDLDLPLVLLLLAFDLAGAFFLAADQIAAARRGMRWSGEVSEGVDMYFCAWLWVWRRPTSF